MRNQRIDPERTPAEGHRSPGLRPPARRSPWTPTIQASTVAAVLMGASGFAQAISGFPNEGGIGFFAATGATAGDTKFFCDWRFDPAISPLNPACAQLDPELVAVQVPPDFQFGLEVEATPIQFTLFRTVTNWTVPGPGPAPRTSLICETAGDGSKKEYCLRITENPSSGIFSGPPSCPQKFVSITANPGECADDLNRLTQAFGAGAHVDWTSDRNDVPENQVHINICTPSSWQCVNMTPSEYLAGIPASNIQQLGSTMVQTPITCTISGVRITYKSRKTCP